MICQLNISDKFKSANFDKRKKKISFIIIHYTETKTLEQAVLLLTDSKRKVSCHYLIDSNGKIFNLVDLKKELGMQENQNGKILKILTVIPLE